MHSVFARASTRVTLFALAAAVLTLAACSNATAPRPSGNCGTGVTAGSGGLCETVS
jgi:hypothetical protein